MLQCDLFNPKKKTNAISSYNKHLNDTNEDIFFKRDY